MTTTTLNPQEAPVYKGFNREQLEQAFDAVRDNPFTVYPILYDPAAWKSPFSTLVPVDEVPALTAAIEFYLADTPIVREQPGRVAAIVSTKGYQAW